MRRDLNKLAMAILLFLLLLLTGCSTTNRFCPLGDVTDPDFNGVWTGNNIQLTIGVETIRFEQCEVDQDLVHGVGLNNQVDAVWDRMAFSGRVSGTGAAEVNGMLWALEGEALREIASFSLVLTRSGNTISFDLDYTAGGVRHQEQYELQR